MGPDGPHEKNHREECQRLCMWFFDGREIAGINPNPHEQGHSRKSLHIPPFSQQDGVRPFRVRAKGAQRVTKPGVQQEDPDDAHENVNRVPRKHPSLPARPPMEVWQVLLQLARHACV